MADYPTLQEMGIHNPQQIDRYSLQTVNNVDILRIVYLRKKGSLLPVSKRFRFGRAEKLILAEGDHRAAQIHHEISPFVRKVLSELDQIVAGKRNRRNQLEIIKEEMQRLQEDTSSRLAYMQTLIDDL